jgi:hypothetical protein
MEGNVALLNQLPEDKNKAMQGDYDASDAELSGVGLFCSPAEFA